MIYFLLLISVVLETLKNICTNYFGKNLFRTMADSVAFNVVSSIGAALFLILTSDGFSVSAYSFVSAVFFAVVSAAASYFSLMALATGPMAAATLFVYMGAMIVPALFGVIFYHQPVTALQLTGSVLMILSLFLSINLRSNKSMTPKWLFFSAGSFVSWGAVGICQLIHQNSEYAHELNRFLMWSFIFMTALFAVIYSVVKKTASDEGGYKMKSKTSVIVMLSGLFIAVVYQINLYLCGKMPGIVFYPAVNGGVLLLSSLAAILFFKEKTNLKQKLGIVLGITAVCFLGL